MLGFKKYNEEPYIYDMKEVNIEQQLGSKLRSIMGMPFVLLCIGTDRCIGDSLGPLVGYNLKKSGVNFPVYGTISQPVHAVNLKDNINDIKENHPYHSIIAIDASLGNAKSVGTIQFREGPIYPGKGVGKKLPPVGNYSIIGVVDALNSFSSNNIHQVRLSLVMEMSEIIAESIQVALSKSAIC